MRASVAVILPALLLLSAWTEAAEHRVGFGSVTAITNFHDLSHHRVRFTTPFEWGGRSALWPDDIEFGVGVLRRNGDVVQSYHIGPLWRWPAPIPQCACFFEASVTGAWLDDTVFDHPHRDGWIQDIGYNFEFISRLSFGVPLGARQRWAVTFSVQHISNGGLGWSNPGADFIGAEIEREF